MSLDQLRKQMTIKFQNIRWKHHPCGFGSLFKNTANTRSLLEDIVEKYNIRTVSDAGAGDLSWVYETKWKVQYTPYDIRKWHKDIVECDITKIVLPKTDLIVCRHVLNHIPWQLRWEAINQFKKSGSTYLFMTHGNPVDKDSPYDLGPPLESCEEAFPPGRTWWFGLWKIN